MGAALNTASASNAYVLSDRGTWLSFKNKGDLGIVVEGDKRLFNQYGVMLVNPEKHPTVKKDLGQQFIDWLFPTLQSSRIARVAAHRLACPSCIISSSSGPSTISVPTSPRSAAKAHDRPRV